MDTIKITRRRFEKCVTLVNLIPVIKDKVPIKDKLTYAVERWITGIENINTKFNDGKQKIAYMNALEHPETKAILYEKNGEFSFSREGKAQQMEELIKYMDEQIEVPVYICPDNSRVSDLHFEVRECFNGILFNYEEKEPGEKEFSLNGKEKITAQA